MQTKITDALKQWSPVFVYPKRSNYLQTRCTAPPPPQPPNLKHLNQSFWHCIFLFFCCILTFLPSEMLSAPSPCGNAVSHGESLEVFPLRTWNDWKLTTSPLSLPVMCISRASKSRQFRSPTDRCWTSNSKGLRRGAGGIWAKWAVKGWNTWKWRLAGWHCCLHIRVVINV